MSEEHSDAGDNTQWNDYEYDDSPPGSRRHILIPKQHQTPESYHEDCHGDGNLWKNRDMHG